MRFLLLALATILSLTAAATALVPRLGGIRTTTVRFSKHELNIIDTHKASATVGVSFSTTISGRHWRDVIGVRVFLNLPTADHRTPIVSHHYVGTFVPRPLGGREARIVRSSNTMSLTKTLAALRASGVHLDVRRPLSITLVPVRAFGAPADVAVTISAINLYARPPVYGWPWWSFDVPDAERNRAFLDSLLNGRYDATEMIATLPNHYLPTRR